MAVNPVNNFLQGGAGLNVGISSSTFNPLDFGSTTRNPQERYHDEWSHVKSHGNKGNVALSAMTLLAFLFFLHILQNCVQEHMHEMKGKKHYYNKPIINGSGFPTVIIMNEVEGTIARDNLEGDPSLLTGNQNKLAGIGNKTPETNAATRNSHSKNQRRKIWKPNQVMNKASNKNKKVTGKWASPSNQQFDQGVKETNIKMFRIDNIH